MCHRRGISFGDQLQSVQSCFVGSKRGRAVDLNPTSFINLCDYRKESMKSNLIRIIVVVFGAVVLFSVSAFAQGTATSNFGVSAQVESECVIDASAGLAFGNYLPITQKTSELNGTGSIKYTCSQNTTGAKIRLGQGTYPAEGSTDAAPLRQMSDGTANLAYFLYQNSGNSDVWGNTTGTAKDLVNTFDGGQQTVTVYGQVTHGQNVEEGTYSDTVQAAIDYL